MVLINGVLLLLLPVFQSLLIPVGPEHQVVVDLVEVLAVALVVLELDHHLEEILEEITRLVVVEVEQEALVLHQLIRMVQMVALEHHSPTFLAPSLLLCQLHGRTLSAQQDYLVVAVVLLVTLELELVALAEEEILPLAQIKMEILV